MIDMTKFMSDAKPGYFIWFNDKHLRLFTFQLWDCSTTEWSLTKKHFLSLLLVNHRKWWQLPVCGFQIWY